jgi:NAD(P)-dependent dehydrogenase (short-subunit alcohol dehydrogenase family)
MLKKTALITGASTGIGLALTRTVLEGGWGVIATSRSVLPDDAVLRGAATAGRLAHYRADLTDYSDLRRIIDQIGQDHGSIDVLFNNAGVMPGSLVFSKQKRELAFELNAVVPYILTMEILPLLRTGETPLVLQTSSNSLLLVKHFAPEELERPKRFKKLTGPYGRSKLALTLWTAAVASELLPQGIHLLSVDPGPTKTPMSASSGMPAWLLPIRHLLFRSPEHAANKMLEIATQPSVFPSGSFVLNGKLKDIPFANCAEAVLSIVRQAYAQFQEIAVPTRSR